MMLNVVADKNYNNKNNIDDVNNYNQLKNKINNKNNTIQRQLKEIQERITNRQDIRDGITKKIDHLNYIENLKDYSFEDNITTMIDIPYNVMLDFHKSIELKYGCNDPISKNIVTLISKFNEPFIDKKQQHSTTSFLKYKGKEPRIDVLHKLKKIVELLYDYNSDGFVHQKTIKQAIKEVLDADYRTAENYFITIKNFVEQMMDEKTSYYKAWNLMGLQDAINEKIHERGNKQDNSGKGNV